MTARSPSAFFLSATLHALVIGVLLLVSYTATQNAKEPAKVFELVAAEGDNYGATEAPLLGTPGGIELNLPPAAAPGPEPVRAVEPPRSEPPVMKAVPPPKTAPSAAKAAPAKTETFAHQMLRAMFNGERRAKREVARERAAEEKRRIAEEKRRAAEEQQRRAAEEKRRQEDDRRMTKEEFDRANKTRSTTKRSTTAKAPRIDTEGIAKGVLNGSAANTVGGAGGRALTATEGSLAERYGAMLLQRLKDELDSAPGLDDGLRAEAEFHIMPDGTLTRARIVRSSGDDTFDRAVLHAIATVRMPSRPRGIDEVQTVPFFTKAKN